MNIIKAISQTIIKTYIATDFDRWDNGKFDEQNRLAKKSGLKIIKIEYSFFPFNHESL